MIIIIIFLNNNENSLLTYFKGIAIHKLKVEKRTIKKLFTIYFDEKADFF